MGMMSDSSTIEERLRMEEDASSSPEPIFMTQENKSRPNGSSPSYHYYHPQKVSLKNILVIFAGITFCINTAWAGVNFLHSTGWLSGLAKSTDIDKINLTLSDVRDQLKKVENRTDLINDKINSIDKSLAIIQGQFMVSVPSSTTVPMSNIIRPKIRQKQKTPQKTEQTQNSTLKIF